MKKITFLMSFLLLLSWQGMAQFTEDFEGTFLPTGWVKETPDLSNDVTQSTTENHTVAGANSVRFSSFSSSSDYNQYLFSQAITVSAPNTELRFWHMKSGDNPETLEWGISTATQASGDVSSWNTVTLNTSWSEEVVNLSAYVGQTIYVSWHYYGNFQYYVYLDDVSLGAPPACPDPVSLNVSNLTLTSADLSWTENGTANTWDIEWDTTGFTPGTGNMITGTTTNPHDLTGLTANTSYDFYVRADCGGANGTSAWVGPFTFFTGYCMPSSSSASTYVDNFSTSNGATNISNLSSGFNTSGYSDMTTLFVESYETGSFDFNAEIVGGTAGFSIWIDWNNDLVFDDLTEKVYNTTSYSDGPFTGTITIPALTAQGDYRMRITTDWNQLNPSAPCGAQSRAEFEDYTVTVGTPPSCLAPSALTATNIDGFSADLGWTDNAGVSTWNIEWDTTGFTPGTGNMITGTSSNPYNLTGLNAETSYEFYVQADCGGSGTSTWVGPFSFTTTVSCQAPSNIMALAINPTDALIGWTENGSSTSWQVEWGNLGFSLGSGFSEVTSSNPYLTMPLMPETPYDFYVRSICGAGDTSVWVGPYTFMTPCIPPVVSTFPWTEDFDGETTPNMPCGWIVDNANADAYTWETGTNQPNSGANAMQVRWNSAEAANDWAFTPELQLTGGVTYQLSFAFSVAGSTFPEKLKVMYGAGQNVAGMTDLLFDSTITNTTYETATALFTPPTTGSYYVGFHNYSDADMFRIYVDDVTIDIATAIEDNMLANNISIYPNPTTGIFTISGTVKNTSVNVMSITGEVVYQNNISGNNTIIDLSNKAKGLYFVSISTENGTETYKVVIQ